MEIQAKEMLSKAFEAFEDLVDVTGKLVNKFEGMDAAEKREWLLGDRPF